MRASARVRSAVSIDSTIACWRLSSAAVIWGQASLRNTRKAAKKTSSVQIISPIPGSTRKLPPSSSAAAPPSDDGEDDGGQGREHRGA